MKRATRRGVGAQRRPAHPLSLQHCLPNGILPLRPSPMEMVLMAYGRAFYAPPTPPGPAGAAGRPGGAQGGARDAPRAPSTARGAGGRNRGRSAVQNSLVS